MSDKKYREFWIVKHKVIIDAEDFDLVSKYKWHIMETDSKLDYARTSVGRTTPLMHRLIIGAKRGQFVDHINRNSLDNRKSNLRFCTLLQNQHNAKPRVGTSKFKGVSFSKVCQKWQSRIRFNKMRYQLGVFKTEEEAACMYALAAIELHGDFLRLEP